MAKTGKDSSKKDSSNKPVYAHFIGVGGAGMSALALVLLQRGVHITGSDLKESRFTRELERWGMNICIGHDNAQLGNPEIVVVSTAIPESNPELKEARRKGLPVWQRAQMLAELTKNTQTIAVAGTHGKTSTSSMLANSLDMLDYDPGFCIGGEVEAFAANARQGSGDLFVIEADESDGSFVWLHPSIAIITNLKQEHVDHYETYEDVEKIFIDFIQRLDKDGILIACGDDDDLMKVARASGKNVLIYGSDPDCDVRYSEVTPFKGKPGSSFVIEYAGERYSTSTTLPGEHMASNATAVFAAAVSLGACPEKVAAVLGSFKGVRRRFELVGQIDDVTVIDDYGHHPTEIEATLKGAKDLDYQRIVVVFQPHRYSRTQAFEREFGAAFGSADLVILTDVFSSGEAPIPGISGRTIVNSVLEYSPTSQVVWLPRTQSLPDYLCHTLRPGDLLITMGAGDVTAVGPEFIRELTQRRSND
ncbi:MAG: UDP-N-acetylmuramate--L-alanine ligase [Coriobacteriia bacterium]|nr:UDP-N-acetylmuramate--L-alanine ligase [Coriobacteriia bacterium]